MEDLEPLKVHFGEWKMQLKPYCEEFLYYLRQVTPVQLYVAIAVLVFTVLLLSFTRLFSRSKSNTTVLAGLSGSGKTVIYYQLRGGSAHQGTVTSIDLTPMREHLCFIQKLRRYLYDILTKSSTVKRKVPLFIFCNKVDNASAHSKELIRKQLEKEISFSEERLQ